MAAVDPDDRRSVRRARQRWLGVLTFAIAAGLVVGLVLVEVHAHTVLKRGVTVVATVMDLRQQRYSTTLLQFTGPGGQTRTQWVGITRDGIKVGDQITVIYDPEHPSDIEDPQELADNERYLPIVYAIGILVFVGIGVFAWMADPDDFAAFVRRRSLWRR